MKKRYINIYNIYKMATVKKENTWKDLDLLVDNPLELKYKWMQYYEYNNLSKKDLISKDFYGFINWVKTNLPESMSTVDGFKYLVDKIINFKPNFKKEENMELAELPDHIKTIAQNKEEQKPFNYNDWKEEIAKIESNGNYKAINKHTNALGKYQFVPSIWWNKIKTFSENKVKLNSYQDFLNNPSIQEEFMSHYTNTSLIPALKRLRLRESTDLPQLKYISDGRLMALFHFQGPTGAVNWIKANKMIGESRNISVPSYLTKVS